MKLTSFLILLFVLDASASLYSQNTKVSVRIQNGTLSEIFQEIEEQSEFRFFYQNEQIQNIDRKTVNVNNQNIESLLDDLLSGSEVAYKIVDRHVIIFTKSEEGNLNNVQQARTISGKVTDSSGAPLPGVTILIKGTTQGTISDFDGNYTLSGVSGDATLVFSFVGMRSLEIPVANQNNINITMEEDAIGIEEVVAVGYGTQKKATLTGAVSAVKGDDIVATKNENAQNMLTGKISGVRVTQKTAEPGSFNNNFDIRAMGNPLIIIDGIPRTNDDFQRLDPHDIDNISVLKDASAAIYGVRAANGVVLVTTKRGTNNKVELNYSGSFTWQIPSGLPATVDAIEYMTLRNERAMHNINGGSPIFNDEQFEDYRSGRLQSTDWYPLVFSDYAPQTMHNLNATGGNDKTTYYVGLGYQYQEGFFKSSDLKYNKYNVRSNITTKITDRLTLDLNLNLVMDQQDRPYQDSWWIIRGFWRQGAHIPAYANDDPTRPYHGLIEGDNPISFMDKDIVGYRQFNKKWIQSSASLQYDIPGIEGLYVKGLFSYDYYVSSSNIFQKEYDQYRYDEASETYSTFTRQSPNRIRREADF
ncbi:SusC/RagA family TonB-linked outer membrane protein, partial [uncultured Sunxiuqinia sp.]|uniref:SusC/RagA family TonB-linked outer membrane protein n=1 Tax=uncultured Sunxiuqinia sp. TaxID=1573825 RepID=UPI0030DC0962